MTKHLKSFVFINISFQFYGLDEFLKLHSTDTSYKDILHHEIEADTLEFILKHHQELTKHARRHKNLIELHLVNNEIFLLT